MIHSEENCQSNFCLCGFRTRETKNIDSREIFNYFEIDIRNADLRPLAYGMVIRKLTFILPIYVSFVIRLISKIHAKTKEKHQTSAATETWHAIVMLWYTRAIHTQLNMEEFFLHSFLLVRDMRARGTDRRTSENIYLFHDEWNENVCKQTLIISRQCEDDV